MNERTKSLFEDPQKLLLIQIVVFLLVAGIIYKITGNIVIAGVLGLFAGFSPKKKKKISLKQKDTSGQSLEAAADPLGENREREHQKRAILILLLALGISIYIYFLFQDADLMKEITEGIRTLE